MAGRDLSPELRLLLNSALPTMDHVAVLIGLVATPDQPQSATAITALTRLQPDVVERTLRDLTASHLVEPEGGGYRYAASPNLRGTVDQLVEMNRTRPVTLVRAIYDRPPRAASAFADAFRLRGSED